MTRHTLNISVYDSEGWEPGDKLIILSNLYKMYF